ncbi:TonB-dependent receptor [Sphingomonas oligophenolica]|uniref:TonB-dependent receptor n=1 Tax=Sphingomonas oligophenolica TaxID=301154 RepID=A0ABU9Y1L7_9SPHN
MNMPLSRAPSRRALVAAFAVPCLLAPATARAEDLPQDILITAQKLQQSIENAPATRATVTADTIATTINAVNVEDTVKYLPSLIVRKRHVGDTQAPLATRTSGLGASARSLIYADGALLSSLIGNNNTLASPRWSLVSPQEIARIDVLYGPFSAAYPGNSIGAVVNITTRLPDTLEATVTAGTNVQIFDQYGTHQTLPAWQIGGTIGDRFGPLALFASVDHVASNGQPLQYVTATRPATTSTIGAPVNGGFDDVNRTNLPIRILGASGFEHQVQDHLKLKAAVDIASGLRVTYVGGLFLNRTNSHAETYLADGASGLPLYAGSSLNIGGRLYTIAPGAFSGGVYQYDERHWSHALSATGTSGRFDWQVIGTLYDFDHDEQRIPTTALPGAQSGGAGTITRLDGTGWKTLDAKGAWTSDDAATHRVSFGAHADWFTLASNRYATTDWIKGSEGALSLQSKGKTNIVALWAQDAWKPLPAVTLTLGGRYEWWRAYDGVNFPSPVAPGAAVIQPRLSANRFSPKASLAWSPDKDWTVHFSFGEAWRFPTVAELYQIVTTPSPGAVPNPNLRPERALSEELSVERQGAHGSVRLSLFNESVKDALISQIGLLTISGTPTPATFIQNVDRTRARGVELAFQRTDIVPRVDLSGSLTYADATTRKDAALPAAEGRLLPSVPRWKSTLVVTWRPTNQVSLTAAGRYASRMYGSLDNSDVVGNTYQGFDKYLVVDLRAQFRVTEHWALGLGVDNINNDRYFLFHPFPQRSFSADMTWRL